MGFASMPGRRRGPSDARVVLRASLQLVASCLLATTLHAQQDVGSAHAVPTGRDLYVDPAGDDANNGLSLETPWKTLKHSFKLLRPGDTLNLRGGAYYESELSIAQSGAPGAPITIRSYPGEQAVIDGSYAEFRTPGNDAWELWDGSLQIFRSVKAYPGAGAVFGHLSEAEGSCELVPYELQGPFATDNQNYAETVPYYYIGPGVFWNVDDGYIYYRSQLSQYQLADGVQVPADPDPRNTALSLYPKGEVLEIDENASHLVLRGLDVRNRSTALLVRSGAHDVTVQNCRMRGGRYHILVRGGSHDVTFDGVTIVGGIPEWIAWTDVKRPDYGRPGHLLQGSAIHLEDDVDGIEIRNCSITGVFDGIGATDMPTNLSIHDNVFDVRDDVLHLGSAGWNIEFHHNLVHRGHAAGPSWSGSGSPPPDKAGTVWIHHNVIDAAIPQRFGRQDPLGLLDSDYQGPLGDGFATGRAFGMHSKSDVTGPAPWKIYHNTIIVADDVHNGGAGQAYRIPWFDRAVPHEVYNNIFVQLGDEWVLREARTADGSQIYDGNLYWAPNLLAGTDLFEDLWDGAAELDFDTLAHFRASAAWAATQAYYAPGWEASGVEGNPLLDDLYVPRSVGPAASGAIDLTGKGWPGLTGETFRGALPPDGSQ